MDTVGLSSRPLGLRARLKLEFSLKAADDCRDGVVDGLPVSIAEL
jgi:hypothetical protein